MRTTTHTLLQQWLLIPWTPSCFVTIICLHCGLIMSTQHQFSHSIGEAFDNRLKCFIIGLFNPSILHQVTLILSHKWQECVLAIINHLRAFVPIEIQCFFVFCIMEALTFHPSASCTDQNALSDLHLNPWEQLNLKIFLETTRHFFVDDLLGIFFCFIWEKLLLHEVSKFLQICCPLV
jgi:hypothetical protein